MLQNPEEKDLKEENAKDEGPSTQEMKPEEANSQEQENVKEPVEEIKEDVSAEKGSGEGAKGSEDEVAEDVSAEKSKKAKKTKGEKKEQEDEDKEEKKEEKEEGSKEDKGAKRWYVVQTYSGQEDRVRDSIMRNVSGMNMGHKIFQVLVPTEETTEIRDGKRVEKVRKMFAGYVFIEMILDDESWYVIRGTPGVAKFIGTKVMPTPVLDKEMQRVLKQIGVKAGKLEVAFEKGEAVRIISGPFRGYTGSIDEVNEQRGKLKTLISIFGRDTPVEVNFEQVQKIV